MDFQQKYLTEKINDTPSPSREAEANEFHSRQQKNVLAQNVGADTAYDYVPQDLKKFITDPRRTTVN